MSARKKIIQDALRLKPAERFILVEAWVEEATKRLEAYKAGELETISFDDMFKKGAV
ncbi:MAG: hypothetical protein DRP78_07250 [Candidatus Omnitrophota bacterium]|nr:MAG: hypothetical protein DRP78_07250 [Candidatus Omnitrophota bacterium]